MHTEATSDRHPPVPAPQHGSHRPRLLVALTLALVAGAAGAQQLTLIVSGGPIWDVPDAREVLAGVAGRPKAVTWSLSSSVGSLSFDLQRGRANPAPGQPYRGSAVTVHCKRAGTVQLKAEPIDPAIPAGALRITCKAGQGGGGNNDRRRVRRMNLTPSGGNAPSISGT